MTRSFRLASIATLLAACTGSMTVNDTGSNDSGGSDAAVDSITPMDGVTDDTGTTDSSTSDSGPSDTGTTTDVPTGSCGGARPDITGIGGTEGLVIGADGTIYYSQSAGVGRMRPGMAQEDNWVSIAGATTVWGLAIDPMHNTLYVGSPSTQRIYTIDLTAASPTATMLGFSAGRPNGLTTAADGSLFYSDFNGGNVYRVDSAGMRTRVTTSNIAQPNGLAFGPDGALYVDSYGAGTVIRLVLSGNMEMSRTTFAMGLGSPDGLAFDSMGNLYVTDNAGGRLYRVNSDGMGTPMMLMSGIGAAANVEFGAGALSCTDIYVASSGALRRYEMGTITGAAVPWH